MKYTFGKEEKLKSRKQIQRLFEEGESLTRFPVKLVYLSDLPDRPTKVGVSVPKRSFKNATDRNRLKRLLRESYRLNKGALCDASNSYSFMFIYIGKRMDSFDRINQSVRCLLRDIEKNTSL